MDGTVCGMRRAIATLRPNRIKIQFGQQTVGAHTLQFLQKIIAVSVGSNFYHCHFYFTKSDELVIVRATRRKIASDVPRVEHAKFRPTGKFMLR